MGMIITDLEGAIRRFHRLLDDNREVLDALNVYPVPDGDTGTNLAMTTRSVVDALDAAPDVADALVAGSLRGARGNSGLILAQALGGFASVIRDSGTELTATVVASALRAASEAAYRSVQNPVEGTILTVLRESAEEAEEGARADLNIEAMLGRVYERACDALARTPQMLDVLARAGVVDAGGAGVTLLLASLVEMSGGRPVVLPEVMFRQTGPADRMGPARPGGAGPPPGAARYEVMFLLESSEEGIERFRREWERVGDDIVVVSGEGQWSCHIHTDDIGAAIEAALIVGTPSQIRVTDLLTAEVHAHHRGAPFEPLEAVRGAALGVVAVAEGPGIVDIFRSLGVQGVVALDGSAPVTAADLLMAVETAPATNVVILPNDRNAVPLAEQVDRLTTKHVAVVPTRSIPQGMAAMYGYDPRSVEMATIEDMAAAASSVLTGEITRAPRDAEVAYGAIHGGDWIGVADGTIVVVDPDLESALRGLVASILPVDADRITIYSGVDAPKSATKALGAWLAELHPRLRIVQVEGGQRSRPYLVAVE